MKILLITFIALFAQYTTFSQSIYGSRNVTESIRTFKDVNALELTGHFVVELIQGDKEEVKIIADDNIHEYVVTENVDGVLKIYMKDYRYLKIKSRRLVITVKDLESLSNSGSGDIQATSQFSTNSLNINLSGSGDIDLNITATELNVSLNGSGDIALLGNSMKLNVTLFGSGDVRAYNLQAGTVTIKATGSGNIRVFANMSLTGSISGNGDVFHKGGASSEISVSGSGEVVKEY